MNVKKIQQKDYLLLELTYAKFHLTRVLDIFDQSNSM